MTAIYSSNSLKKWDDYTVKHTPISSIDLMEKAAIACSKQILGNYIFERVTLFCGLGNNGGDGLAIARILHERGVKVSVYLLGDVSKGCENLILNKKRLPKAVEFVELSAESELNFDTDLIVDAIFGSGLNRAIEGWIGEVIIRINNHKAPKVAIDLPSGLFADDNRNNELTHCVKADRTLTIQVPKMAFFFAEYEQFVGKVKVVDIDLHPEFEGDSIGFYVDKKIANLSTHSNFIHKGKKGYLTVIGGFDKMSGALILTSKAGFKTGCGYVGAIGDEQGFTALLNHLPEAIFLGNSIKDLSDKTNAIAIGPGLGQSKKAAEILETVLQKKTPLVVDADGINLIAKNDSLKSQLPKNTILTPHLGELERLIGTCKSPEERLEKQLKFSIQHKVYIIQKGAYSKLTSPNGKLYINSTGNKGMASAGMGDALTGMIGSFLAQGYSPLNAALNGMYYHGLAGDIGVEKHGERGFLTSDLIAAIPAALNDF